MTRFQILISESTGAWTHAHADHYHRGEDLYRECVARLEDDSTTVDYCLMVEKIDAVTVRQLRYAANKVKELRRLRLKADRQARPFVPAQEGK